jgi:creatinine amidohydrolase
MRLEDLNWMDVETYLKRDDRIILITGATEQHAYLSLATDILIPSRMALAVAEDEPVLIAPPFNFGYSRYFAAFPGTISLTQATFALVLTEIVTGLHEQGFNRFFCLNGHGGNLQPAALTQIPGVQVIWYNWWKESAVKQFEAAHGMQLTHANWGENFPFNRVAESPAEPKEPWVTGLPDADDIYGNQALLGDGSFGGAYQVEDSLMHELFTVVVAEIIHKLRSW